MGEVDNIFLVLGNAPQQQPVAMNEDIIVASSDSEGHDEEAHQPPQADIPLDVQVFIPMHDDAPLQLIPEDIPEHELMDFADQ
jgi:hypothetical protein